MKNTNEQNDFIPENQSNPSPSNEDFKKIVISKKNTEIERNDDESSSKNSQTNQESILFPSNPYNQIAVDSKFKFESKLFSNSQRDHDIQEDIPENQKKEKDFSLVLNVNTCISNNKSMIDISVDSIISKEDEKQTFTIGDVVEVYCENDGVNHRGQIIDIQKYHKDNDDVDEEGKYSVFYYIHFLDIEKRMDNWFDLKSIVKKVILPNLPNKNVSLYIVYIVFIDEYIKIYVMYMYMYILINDISYLSFPFNLQR